MSKPLTLTQALSWIVISTVAISGTSTYFFKRHLKESLDRRFNPAYHIVRLVQTGPQREALKTTYLAELMGLSIDQPQSVFLFDVKKAEKALLRSHVIREAHVKVIPPQTVYVDYVVRQPKALLYDCENIAVDEEGYLFPLHPFFPPKKLPEIYFGGSVTNPLRGKACALAFHLVRLIEEQSAFHLKRIDVSRLMAPSYGRREVIVQIEDEVVRQGRVYLFPRLLRLSVKDYAQELGNYMKLREQLLTQECRELPVGEQDTYRFPEKIIDLRLPNLAFIQDRGT